MHALKKTVPAQPQDVIAALATAIGGAVAIIRISGAGAAQLAGRVWSGKASLPALPPRQLQLGRVEENAEVLDAEVLAVHFPGPGSFTGEDLVELHCHGGSLGARLVLQAVLRAGARPAEAGEFSKRAFLNGRIDLTRAEAVNDLIRAQSHAAVRVANTQLQGGLAAPIKSAWETCREILGELEVTLDFPEEDATPVADTQKLCSRLQKLLKKLQCLAASRLEGEIIREGISLVIAGPPNAGKSTLLNAILGRDRAIVSDIPGTTRDTLEEPAHIRNIPVRLTDTAGIREASNAIEEQGVQRSHSALQTAQIVLWLSEWSVQGGTPQAPQGLKEGAKVIEIVNKIDRAGPDKAGMPGDERIYISALTSRGIEDVFDAVETAVWSVPHHAVPGVAVSERHAHCLDRACEDLRQALQALETVADAAVAAAALAGTLAQLGEILGRTITSEDILSDIFSQFCMGK